MSRQRKRGRGNAARVGTGVAAPDKTPQSSSGERDVLGGQAAIATREDEPRTPAARRLLMASVVFAAAWILFLILLVVFTANPPVLNFRQIASADYVVQARIVDRQQGSADVEQVWEAAPFRGGSEPPKTGRLTIENLKDAPAVHGEQSYLIPLVRARLGQDHDAYVIPSVRNPAEVPQIYPATPAAKTRLVQILERLALPARRASE